MFFSLDIRSFPAIKNFEQAVEFMAVTKPMQSGRNAGVTPLRISRDAQAYWMELRHGSHPVTGEQVAYYAAVQHGTEIVRWYEDGTISIHRYPSKTTEAAQSALLRGLGVYTCTQEHKCLAIMSGMLDPNMDMTFLVGKPFLPDDLRSSRGNYVRMFFDNRREYMVLEYRGNDTYRPMSYGVAFGPGRKYHNPLHGTFIRAIQKACRALVAFSQKDEPLEVIEGVLTSETRERSFDYIDEVIESTGWTPGKQITGSILNAMLENLRYANTWQERLAWCGALRQEPKPLCEIAPSLSGEGQCLRHVSCKITRIVGMDVAHKLCEEIEAISREPVL